MIDWRHWHNEPFLIGGLVFFAWLYALLTGPFRARLDAAAPYPSRRAAAFYASLVIFYVAVGSPLDQVSEQFLLSAHMVQHELLMYPAAVLFLLGLPDWLIRPLVANRAIRPLLWLLTRPVVAGAVFVLTFTIWHVPALYEWTLQDKLAHVLEHLMFFGAAPALLVAPGEPVARPPPDELCGPDALPRARGDRHDAGLRVRDVRARGAVSDL